MSYNSEEAKKIARSYGYFYHGIINREVLISVIRANLGFEVPTDCVNELVTLAWVYRNKRGSREAVLLSDLCEFKVHDRVVKND